MKTCVVCRAPAMDPSRHGAHWACGSHEPRTVALHVRAYRPAPDLDALALEAASGLLGASFHAASPAVSIASPDRGATKDEAGAPARTGAGGARPISATSRERVRPRTISVRRTSKRALAATAELYPESIERPSTRGECERSERPCPFVGCRFHLYLDITRIGSILFNHPHREPEELSESCALDVAQRGGVTLEAIAEILNVTRERVRQIETRALRRMARRLEAYGAELGV